MKPDAPDTGAPRRLVRVFATGTLCGFAAGALTVSSLVWHHGNVIGSRAEDGVAPDPPRAVERWTAGIDDAGDAVLAGGPTELPVAAPGARPPIDVPAPPAETVVDSPPAAVLARRELRIPVEGVTADQLFRSFADDRNGRRHEALDILAPRHTPVVAVEAGTIARLFRSRGGGLTIYQFDPSERFCYYYAHLERYADGLSEGQAVRKGQVIGYVGTSGNAPPDTPHLHFAIFVLTPARRWWEGTPIDPFDVLG